jgi:hypothetical protein|tara:strand:- start:79 stop:543 length:465 start_codon:yes stop_codon:yes gene_type:complete
MMKKFTLLLFIIASTSCAVKQKPTFIKVDNIKLITANSTKITVSADALFNNPNVIGGRLNTEGVQVYVNDISFGRIETEEFKVPANDDFTVPLKIQIKTKDLLDKDSKGFLNGLLNSVLNRSLKVRYEGTIQFKALGINHSYPINKTETIKIKL